MGEKEQHNFMILTGRIESNSDATGEDRFFVRKFPIRPTYHQLVREILSKMNHAPYFSSFYRIQSIWYTLKWHLQ